LKGGRRMNPTAGLCGGKEGIVECKTTDTWEPTEAPGGSHPTSLKNNAPTPRWKTTLKKLVW